MSLVNTLRRHLMDGGAIGGWQGIASPLVSEAMASLGFHWIAIDMEHATIGPDQAQACFVAMERHGCAPLVRLPSADPYLARRLLDAGAQGIIIPVVEDALRFDEFSRHLAYPPHGRRGVGLSRCNLWGDHFQSYLEEFRPLIVPQIETLKGVEQAAAIAALPQVDALFLGPYDLSADMGRPARFDDPAFVAACDRVTQACKAQGKAAGIHVVQPDPEQLRRRLAEGFRFVAYGTDVIALRTALGRPADLLED